MAVFGCTNEIVVLDVHELPQILRFRDDLVNVFNRCYAVFRSLLLKLLAVFIRSGQEIGIIPLQLFETGHRIGRDGRIGMADGHVAGRIIDWRSDVEGFFTLAHGSFLLCL